MSHCIECQCSGCVRFRETGIPTFKQPLPPGVYNFSLYQDRKGHVHTEIWKEGRQLGDIARDLMRLQLDRIEEVLREALPGPAIPMAVIYYDHTPVGIEFYGGTCLYMSPLGTWEWTDYKRTDVEVKPL